MNKKNDQDTGRLFNGKKRQEQEINIWQKLPKYFTVLAPMEGVTDVVFRQVINRASRPDLFFTEFTNVSSFVSEKGRHDALERLAICPTDRPIIAQIWGKNPEHFAVLSSELEPMGFQGLDINMGCPDRHVNKAGGGAMMIRTPELATKCIKEAQCSTRLPVSVKTRLGFTYVEEFREWLPSILNNNIANLTIHLRTRKEMSKVPAHIEIIPEILEMREKIAPETKITVNGDIRDLQDVKKLIEKYPEVDGFMIGRGIFSNPFCFSGRQMISNGGDISIEELIALFRYHLDLFDQRDDDLRQIGSRYPYEPLKRMFKLYIHSFDGAAELRMRLMSCKNTTELRNELDLFMQKRV